MMKMENIDAEEDIDIKEEQDDLNDMNDINVKQEKLSPRGNYDYLKENNTSLQSFTLVHQNNVNIYPSGIKGNCIQGSLSICADKENPTVRFLTWNPLKNGPEDENLLYSAKIPLLEILSIRRYLSVRTPSYIIIMVNGGVTFPPFYFESSLKDFFTALELHTHLKRSREDSNTLCIEQPNNNNKSASRSFLSSKELFSFKGQKSKPPELKEIPWDIMGGLSKVSKFAKKAQTIFTSPPNTNPPIRQNSDDKNVESSILALDNRNNNNNSVTNGDIYVSNNQNSPRLNIENFQSIVQLKDPITRGNPLTVYEWMGYYDREGRINKILEPEIRRRIHYGGVVHEIRSEVWKYLLGVYKFGMSLEERTMVNIEKRTQYNTVKSQWTSVSAEQASKFKLYRQRREAIEKDTPRTTDLVESPYVRDSKEVEINLSSLFEILMTYSFYNFDTSYVQGMNDLCGAILTIIGDESETFACFVGLMNEFALNFEEEQTGVNIQLSYLQQLVALLDSEFYKYLNDKNSINMYFCFRWILVLFRREFSFDTITRLWDVLWAKHLTRNFHIFLCLAALEKHKGEIMSANLGFDGILKYVNNLSGKMELEPLLIDAEMLYHRFTILNTNPEMKSFFSS